LRVGIAGSWTTKLMQMRPIKLFKEKKMPNMCANRLFVAAPSAEAAEVFLQQVKGESKLLSFNKTIPHPKVNAYDHRPSWYPWNRNNWGTKWDAMGEQYLEKSPDGKGLTLRFYTAWAPPVPVILKLGVMFPDLDFDLEYDDPCERFKGTVRMEHGRIALAEVDLDWDWENDRYNPLPEDLTPVHDYVVTDKHGDSPNNARQLMKTVNKAEQVVMSFLGRAIGASKKCAVPGCNIPICDFRNLCLEHELPGIVVEVDDSKMLITTWRAEHGDEVGVIYLNDRTVGDMFGGREGFEAQLAEQGLVNVRLLETQQELDAAKQPPKGKKIGDWGGPWMTKYPWELTTAENSI